MSEPGFIHDCGFYASDTEFRTLLLGHLEPALAGGAPIILAYSDHRTAQIRRWLPDTAAVTYFGGRKLYASPARTIAAYRRMFTERAEATRIYIAGDVPHEGNGGTFAGWDRYEAAVNTAWDDFPVHGLCLYDAVTSSARVRDVVERTHPHTRRPSGARLPNPGYTEPAAYRVLAPAPDALTTTEPLVTLSDPRPHEARRVVAALVADRLTPGTAEDLLIGVSEAVTNANHHGRLPIVLRLWTGHDRVLVQVSDRGPGPSDPLAGLVRSAGRAGLWLVHQLDLDVDLFNDQEGFTVRLRCYT
jgi:anti-sigma regulatory factor (Ser/Thr protein kinase)